MKSSRSAEAAARQRCEPAAMIENSQPSAPGDTRALDGVDLSVPSGVVYALPGPSRSASPSLDEGLFRPNRPPNRHRS
jgi:hypothetical protein